MASPSPAPATTWPSTTKSLAQLLEVARGSYLKCHGYSMHKPTCNFDISNESTREITVVLKKIVDEGRLSPKAKSLLEDLSSLVLCQKHHQWQAPGKYKDWIPKLEKLRPAPTAKGAAKSTAVAATSGLIPSPPSTPGPPETARPPTTPPSTSLSTRRYLRSCMTITWSFLRKISRPRLREGYRRLEWTCECGELLYADMKRHRPGLSQEQGLTESLRVLAFSRNGGSTSPGSLQRPSLARTHIRAGPSQLMGWTGPGSNQQAESSAGPSNAQRGQQAAIPPLLSLRLCIKSGRFSQMTWKVEVQTPTSDGALFQRIMDKYQSARPALVRLAHPAKAVFVKYRVDQPPFVSRVAGTEESPAIPPESEVHAGHYSYNPCPIDGPPMTSDTFLHYLYTPAHKHKSSLFGPRLPKKTEHLRNQDAMPFTYGWGIEIVEGPNWGLINALMFLFLLVSGAVAGIYAWQTDDKQTAVAIGTWLTTVQTMGLSALSFWWEH